MALTAQQAYNEIVAHIGQQKGSYPTWYCGITNNIEERLFGYHQVPRKDYWMIYRECVDNQSARAVEETLLKLGCRGGSGGGDNTSRFVYAYLIGVQTKE